ncbi:hypothetical protein LLG46_00650 [bacterium]|nr:hypothetical protein [bacterium]
MVGKEKTKYGSLGASIVIIVLLFLFVWPGPFRYIYVLRSQPIKIDRISNRVYVLGKLGWKQIAVNKTEVLSANNLRKLKLSCGEISPVTNTCSCILFNGTDIVVSEITIHLAKTDRIFKLKPQTGIDSLCSGHMSAVVDQDFSEQWWGSFKDKPKIIGARGYRAE